MADPVPVACGLFAPIAWSAADSDATVRAAKAHNAVWDALCGRRADRP